MHIIIAASLEYWYETKHKIMALIYQRHNEALMQKEKDLLAME